MEVVADAIRRDGHDHDVAPMLSIVSLLPDGTEARWVCSVVCGQTDPSRAVEHVLRDVVPVRAVKAVTETGGKVRAVIVHSTAWVRTAKVPEHRNDLTDYSPSALFADGLSPRQAAAANVVDVKSLAVTCVIDSTGDLVAGGFIYDDATGDHEPYERESAVGDGRQTDALRECMFACQLLDVCAP